MLMRLVSEWVADWRGPLKYVKGLANAMMSLGGSCFEQTPALAVMPTSSGVCVTTPAGRIHAEHCVIACGGYMQSFSTPVSKAMLPISTYIVVTEPLQQQLHEILSTSAAVYDTRFAFDYYRPLPDTRLLWGGRISTRARSAQALTAMLRRDMARVFPSLGEVNIDFAWGGLMGYTRHHMPLIGRTQRNIWHVTGFGGHGVAPTTAGGELIAQAIVGENDDWQRFEHYGPKFAGGPLGLVGAQLTYWALQGLDQYREWRDRL